MVKCTSGSSFGRRQANGREPRAAGQPGAAVSLFRDRRRYKGVIRHFNPEKDFPLIENLIQNTSKASLEMKTMQPILDCRLEYARNEQLDLMRRNLPKLTSVLLAIVLQPDGTQTASIAELDSGGERTCEMSFHVHEADLRQGIGTKLVAAALAEARRRGFGRAVVHVWHDNVAMLTTFEKAGFVRTASENGEIAMSKDLASVTPDKAPTRPSPLVLTPIFRSSVTNDSIGRSPSRPRLQTSLPRSPSPATSPAFQESTTKAATARA